MLTFFNKVEPTIASGLIGLVENPVGLLQTVACWGMAEVSPVVVGESSADAIRQKRPVISLECSQGECSHAASAAYPMLFKDRVVGVLTVCSMAPEGFDPREIDLLMEVAGDLAYGVITLRTRRELEEAEEKYRQLFEMESDAILLVADEDGAILEANPSAQRLYGYSREELRAMTVFDLSAEPEKTGEVLASKSEDIALRYALRKDSSVFPVEVRSCYFFWQGRDVHLAAIRDISARMEAERQKAQLEEQFRQAQKMEAIGTLAAGIAHDFNNILSPILGYTQLFLLQAPKESPLRLPIEKVRVAARRRETWCSRSSRSAASESRR